MGNTPNIRFKGFTDDWEQRKLGEICQRVIRKNKNNESDLPLTIASQYGLIDQRDFFNKVVAAKDMSNYYLLRKGEFAYNKSYSNGFEYGSIKRLNAYEQGCLSTLYICFEITSDEVDSDYLECFFDTLKWYGDLSMICAEGARNHGLLNVDIKAFFADINVSTPTNLKEQRKIATYLNNLDHLITLHQRKCDETKKLKKFMLQKMFPKKDAKKPEIRFAGFTDDWEQRKLIDYLEVSSEKNRDNRFTKDDVLSVSGEYGIVNQIEFQGRSFAGASVSNYGVVENGDVVYTKSPLKSNPYGIIKTNKGIPGIVSTLYAVYKPKEITDSKFVQIYFELDSRMNSYMHPLVNKGAKNDMKVSAENALKGMVSFPKKDEQEMISLYFSSLDNLIALHQRKLFLNFAKRNDWEQRKLGEVSDVRDGTHDSPKYQSIGHPFVTSKNVKNGYITYDDIQYISDEDFAEINKRSKVDINDILMGMIGTIGNMALIRTEPDFAIKNVALIKDTKQINYLYLYHLLQSPFIEKQLTSGMDGGTQKFVSLGNVRNLNVIYPSDIEQDKIGCYFEKLDHLITLHRRAYYNKKGGLTNVHNDNQQHYAIL